MNNEQVRIFADKEAMKRHFETALQIDKERQSVILKSIGDAVIATDMDGSIILMNAVAEKLTGWKSEEAESKPIAKVFHIVNKFTRKEIDDPVESVLKTGKVQKLAPDAILISRAEREEYSVSDSCAPILNPKGNIMGAVLVFRDVTKQKQEEALKEKITADLIQRNNDHEHFDNIISHDLKGPVANIISLAKMVNDEELEESEKEMMMNALLTSAERLNEVIVDLNVILRIGKQLDEKKESVHFSKIVSDIQESIANILEKEKPNFKLDFKRVDEMFTIKSYTHSIFYNLISNSIKYKKSGIPLDITIESDLVDKKVILTFKDNGMGVDLLKYGNDLFGLYKRFHIGKADGKGMGLHMVKVQVEKLGGKISVKSIVNQGTEFTIELIP
ncbi:sensor histidine kinase [Flavobacterium lacus]|uniref:histidine kinase n=1 Tax=Flavobacterium lacus TaxID=1353778 RepID=A0A328WMX9_9FLAO|nr:ATP-binding protein [Flavobacterium lacus]RAR47631.1 PAS domain S-box-containing protein [Flavobacterium lacus]